MTPELYAKHAKTCRVDRSSRARNLGVRIGSLGNIFRAPINEPHTHIEFSFSVELLHLKPRRRFSSLLTKRFHTLETTVQRRNLAYRTDRAEIVGGRDHRMTRPPRAKVSAAPAGETRRLVELVDDTLLTGHEVRNHSRLGRA